MSYASTEFMLVVLAFGGHFGKEKKKNVLLQYCQLIDTAFLGMTALREFFDYITCIRECLL